MKRNRLLSKFAFIKTEYLKKSVLFLLLFLAACTPRYQPAPPPQYTYRESTQIAYADKPKPMAAKGLIIVDPGHGGDDEGTKSLSKPVYSEKSFNLITAKFVSSYLRQMGYQVLMTRIDDNFVSLKNRYEMTNRENPRLFVSVHYNAAPSSDAHGIEVFYYRSEDNQARTQESKKLAQLALNQIISSTQAKSRGIKHGDYAVIRETKVPAILVEGGFLSNDDELSKIKDPNYLKQVAWGIAQGINKYLSLKDEG